MAPGNSIGTMNVAGPYFLGAGALLEIEFTNGSSDVVAVTGNAIIDGTVAFMPFGYVVDKWRYGVFDGSIAASGYEAGWSQLRQQYQGIVPPVPRSEADFDPGAKFHIPGNTPYARYLLARVLRRCQARLG